MISLDIVCYIIAIILMIAALIADHEAGDSKLVDHLITGLAISVVVFLSIGGGINCYNEHTKTDTADELMSAYINRQSSDLVKINEVMPVDSINQNDLNYLIENSSKPIYVKFYQADRYFKYFNYANYFSPNRKILFTVNNSKKELPIKQTIYEQVCSKRLKHGVSAFLVKGKITQKAANLLDRDAPRYYYRADWAKKGPAINFNQEQLVIINNKLKRP